MEERKSKHHPPKFPKLDRINRQKYSDAYDTGIALSVDVLKFVEFFENTQASGTASALSGALCGGIIGGVVCYGGGLLLALASPPVAVAVVAVAGVFLGGGVGYSVIRNPRVLLWLKQIRNHCGNLRVLMTPRSVFLEGEDSVQMVDEMSKLHGFIDSGFLKML